MLVLGEGTAQMTGDILHVLVDVYITHYSSFFCLIVHRYCSETHSVILVRIKEVSYNPLLDRVGGYTD